MTAYRTVWMRFWAAVVVISIAVAAVAWGPLRTTAFFVVVAVSTLAPAICYFRERVQPDSPAELWRATVRSAVIAGAVGVAVIAMIHVTGAVAVVTLAAAVVSSPWVVGALHRLGSRGAARSAPQGGRSVGTPRPELSALPHAGLPHAGLGSLTSMSDRELCRAWRDSFRALLDAIEPRAKCRVVRLRQTYLEELERRHPDALGAWLASSPRPSAGPEKFLGPAGDGRDAA